MLKNRLLASWLLFRSFPKPSLKSSPYIATIFFLISFFAFCRNDYSWMKVTSQIVGSVRNNIGPIISHFIALALSRQFLPLFKRIRVTFHFRSHESIVEQVDLIWNWLQTLSMNELLTSFQSSFFLVKNAFRMIS